MTERSQKNFIDILSKMGDLFNAPLLTLKNIINQDNIDSLVDAISIVGDSPAILKFKNNLKIFLSDIINFDFTTVDDPSRKVLKIFYNMQASIVILILYVSNIFASISSHDIDTIEITILISLAFLLAYSVASDPKSEIRKVIQNSIQEKYPDIINAIQEVPVKTNMSSISTYTGVFVTPRDIYEVYRATGIYDDKYIINNLVSEFLKKSTLKQTTTRAIERYIFPRCSDSNNIIALHSLRAIQEVYDLINPTITQFPLTSDPSLNLEKLIKLIRIRNILLAIAIALALSGGIATIFWSALTSTTISKISLTQFSPLICLGFLASILGIIVLKLSFDVRKERVKIDEFHITIRSIASYNR
jgi:uncharacterized membrane protein YkvA (DUF1232 family)